MGLNFAYNKSLNHNQIKKFTRIFFNYLRNQQTTLQYQMFSCLKSQVENLQQSQRQCSQRYDYYNRFHTHSKQEISETLTLDCRRVTPTHICKAYHSKMTKNQQVHPIQILADKFIQTFISAQGFSEGLANNQAQNFPILNIVPESSYQGIENKFHSKYSEIYDSFHQLASNVIQQIQNTETNDMAEMQINTYTMNLFKIYDKYVQQNTFCNNKACRFQPLKRILDRLLTRINDKLCFSCLLFTPHIHEPDTFFAHPLLFALIAYIQDKSNSTSQHVQDESLNTQKCPKIAFINLDGYDSPLNTHLALLHPQAFFYASIYHEKQQVKPQTQSLQQALSESIFKYKKVKSSIEDCVFQIPMHSKYVKRVIKTKNGQDSVQNDIKYVECLNGESDDLMYVFKQLIEPKLAQWKPKVIVVSYTNFFQIKSEHFNEMIRSLTVISSHRVILVPNLSIKPSKTITQLINIDSQNCQYQQNQQQFITAVNSFYQNKIQQINEKQPDQNFYRNLANFMNISTGNASLASHFQWKKYDCIENSERLLYLNSMRQIIQRQQLSDIMQLQGLNLLQYFKQSSYKIMQSHRNQQYEQIINISIQQCINALQNLDQKMIKKLNSLKQKQQNMSFSLTKYLQKNKNKILFENALKPKLERFFNIRQPKQSIQQYVGYVFYDKQSEQKLILQNYSQVIFGQNDQVFVFNCPPLSNKGKTKYFYGRIANASEQHQVILNQINFVGRKLPNFHHYVNFSHCFTSKYLILYWPYKYNLVHQTICKLLGIHYVAPIDSSLFIVQLNLQEKIMQEIMCKQQGIQPRISSSAIVIGEDMFVFGGFYSFEWSQKITQVPIAKININFKDLIYQILEIKASCHVATKPKSHYKIQKNCSQTIKISQGIGYQFTNLFSMFPEGVYEFNYRTKQLIYKRLASPLILCQPIITKQKGQYIQIQSNRNCIQFNKKEGFVDAVRYILPILKDEQTFSFDSFTDKQLSNLTTVSEFSDFQQNISFQAKQFQLCPFYNYWSPYVKLKQGNSSVQIQLLVQSKEFLQNIWINQYVFPNEDSIISVYATNRGKIYLLSCSQFYNKSCPTIYESLDTKQDQIIQKNELKMNRIYEIKSNMSVEAKSLYVTESSIKILGGKTNEHGVRQNYEVILKDNKKKLKVYTLKYPEEPYLIQSINAQIVQTGNQNQIILYSLSYDFDAGWCLKVQKIDEKQCSHQFCISQIVMQDLRTQQRLNKQLFKPYIIRIQKHKPLSIQSIKAIISTIIILLNKKYQYMTNGYKILNQIRNLAGINSQKKLNFIIVKSTVLKIISLIKKIPIKIDREIKEKFILILQNAQKQEIYNINIKNIYLNDPQELYWITIQDQLFKKWAYIGIGILGSTQLTFYRTKKFVTIFQEDQCHCQYINKSIKQAEKNHKKTEAFYIKRFQIKHQIWTQ